MVPNENLAVLLENAADSLDPEHRGLITRLRREAIAQRPVGGDGAEHRGVWVAYYGDWSAFVVYETEVDALREAVHGTHGDRVTYVPYGEPVRHYIEAARQAASPEQEPI